MTGLMTVTSEKSYFPKRWLVDTINIFLNHWCSNHTHIYVYIYNYIYIYTHTYTTISTFNGQTQMTSSLFLAGLKLSSFSSFSSFEQVSITNIFWVCVPLLSYFLLMFFVSWAIARYILSGPGARGWHMKQNQESVVSQLVKWRLGDENWGMIKKMNTAAVFQELVGNSGMTNKHWWF